MKTTTQTRTTLKKENQVDLFSGTEYCKKCWIIIDRTNRSKNNFCKDCWNKIKTDT